MSEIEQVMVTRPLKGNWNNDSHNAYIDLELENGKTLRMEFPDTLTPDLIVAFQMTQKLAIDERLRLGLPAMAAAKIKKIARYDYGSDQLQQVALVRTEFHDGTFQDTPFGVEQMKSTIEHFSKLLDQFENQSPQAH